MAANNIYIQVDFHSDNADAAIDSLNKKIQQIGSTSDKASKQSTSAFKGFSVSIEETDRAVTGLMQSLAGLGVVRLGTEMARSADNINKMQIAFEGMLGSGQRAADMMGSLRAVADKSPFAFEDIAAGAQRLKTFGFEASKIPAIMTTISAAAAGTGGTVEKLNTVILALGEMSAKGILQGKELYRQLVGQVGDVVPFLRTAIQKETGQLLSDSDIRKLVEKGRITGRAAADAIIEGLQGRFGEVGAKMMDLVTVQFTKLTDELQKLAQTIMADVGPALTSMIKDLREMVKWFEDLPPPVRYAIEAFAGLAGAVGVANAAFKTLGLIFSGSIISKIIEWAGAAEGATVAGEGLAGVGGLLATALTPAAVVIAGMALGAGAVMAMFAAFEKLTDKMVDYRKAKAGVFSDTFKDSSVPEIQALRAMADAMAGYGEDSRKIAEKIKKTHSDLLMEDFQMREAAQKKLGDLATRGLGDLGMSTTDDELKRQIRVLHQMIDEADKAHHAQLIAANEAEWQHLDDMTRAALERSQARAVGGVNAVKYQIDEMNAEIAKAEHGVGDQPPASPAVIKARVKLIGQLDTQHVVDEALRKSGEERAAMDQKLAEQHIEGMKKASEIEVELASQSADASYAQRAEAVMRGYDLLVQNEQNITAATMVEIDKRERAEVAAYLTVARVEGDTAAQIWMKLGGFELQYRKEREKAAVESAERIGKKEVEIGRDVFDTAKEMNTQYTELQEQNLLDQARRAGEIAKILPTVVPAQTEDARRAQADAVASAEIAAQTSVYEAQKLIDKARYDDRVQALADEALATEESVRKTQEAINGVYAVYLAERQKAEQEQIQSTALYELEARKKINEAIIADQKEVFDQIQGFVEKLYDVFTAKNETFAKRLGDMLKSAFSQAAKDAITSHVSAFFTEAVGKGHVGFGGGPMRQILGKEPIFGGDKVRPLDDIELVTFNGVKAMPTYSVNQPPPAQVTQHNTQTINTDSGSYSGSGDFGAPSSGGSGSGGFFAPNMPSGFGFGGGTSSSGGGAFPSAMPPGFGFGGDGAAATPFGGAGVEGPPASLDSLGLGSLMGGSSGGGFSLASLASAGGLGQQISKLSALGNLSKTLGITGGLGSGGPGAVSLASGSMLPGLGLAAAFAGLTGARALGTHGTGGLIGGAFLGAGSALFAGGALSAMFPLIFPALLAGPIGIAALLGAGALVGLSSTFIKTADQKVRSKVNQVYGVDIAQKNIRMQIVQIAQQKYGGNLDVAIASPEVQQIVQMYAIATGKNPRGMPRPMYSATLTESGGGVNLQPVYAGGNVVADPYSGVTTTQYAQLGQSLNYLGINPDQALSLLSGQVTQVMAQNPGTVAQANAAAVVNGSSRDAQAGALMEPLTVLS